MDESIIKDADIINNNAIPVSSTSSTDKDGDDDAEGISSLLASSLKVSSQEKNGASSEGSGGEPFFVVSKEELSHFAQAVKDGSEDAFGAKASWSQFQEWIENNRREQQQEEGTTTTTTTNSETRQAGPDDSDGPYYFSKDELERFERAVSSSKGSHDEPQKPKKSRFRVWIESHQNSKGKTSLEQQIELSKRLYDDAVGAKEENSPTTNEIVSRLERTPITSSESLVTWKGFRVGWFLDIFCNHPYMLKLKEFGCQLWLIRKVCIIEIIRRAHMSVKKEEAEKILYGPFVNHIATVVSGLGLENGEHPPDSIVEDATTFISYTGGYTLEQTILALQQLDPNEYIWMDIFCVDQFAWTGKSRSKEMDQFKVTFLDDLQGQIKAIRKTALILEKWDNVMKTLEQIWVLWEIFNTAEADVDLSILLPPDQKEDFIQNCLVTVAKGDIVTSLSRIDAETARADDDGDRKAIFDRMQQAGLHNVNSLVSKEVRGWLIGEGKRLVKRLRKEPEGPSPTVLNNMGNLLKDEGKMKEAEFLFQEALDKCNQISWVVDKQKHIIAVVKHNFAYVLCEQGKLGEAEPLFRQALEMQRKELGDEHPQTLSSINDLAGVLRQQGNMEEAGSLLKEALEGRQKVLGPDHIDTLTCMGNMAVLLASQGKLDEAVSMAKEHLDVQRRLVGNDHPRTLTSITNLGALLQAQGNDAEAESLFRESLMRSRKVLGNSHPDTVASMGILAKTLYQQDKLVESTALYREIATQHQAAYGRNHPITLSSLDNLAMSLHSSKEFEEAEPLLREVLDERCVALGGEHPDTAASFYNLALLLQHEGKLEEAATMYQLALVGQRKSLGNHHQQTLVTLLKLVELLLSNGSLQRAQPLCREILGFLLSGEDVSQKDLATINHLAFLLKNLGDNEMTELLCVAVFKRRQEVLGPDHPETLSSANNLAVLYQLIGKLEESEFMMRKCLVGYRKLCGSSHPHTLQTIINLALLLDQKGDKIAAEPLLREALTVLRASNGDHPETLKVCLLLSVNLDEQGKKGEAPELIEECVQKSIVLLGASHPFTARCLAAEKSILKQSKTQGRSSSREEEEDLFADSDSDTEEGNDEKETG